MSAPLPAECSLPCASCGAPTGAPCHSRAGRPVPPHAPRARALAPLPPPQRGTVLDEATRQAVGWDQLRGTYDAARAQRLAWRDGGQWSRDMTRALPTACHTVEAHLGHHEAEAALRLAGYVVNEAWLDGEKNLWQRWALPLNQAQRRAAYAARRDQ